MIRMNGGLSRTKKITYTSMMIALAVTLRLIKYVLFGNLQFVNFPGVFTLISGILFGPVIGTTVGFASYLLSDMLLGMPGPWTVVNSILMAALGLTSGIIWSRKDKTKISRTGIGIGAYMLMFVFDILASGFLFVIIGMQWTTAFISGLIGLLLPGISGGYLIAVGPITEATTAILTVMIVHALIKSGKKIHTID